MKGARTAALLAAAAIAAVLAGCEIGTHPVIFDGTAASARFAVNAEIPPLFPPAFSVSDSVDLGSVYEDYDEVDSIKFYNLTFIAEGDSAALDVRITGTIDVDGTTFLRFDNVPLSTFSPERSIFSPAPGFSYDPAGLQIIRQALAPGAADRQIRMSGNFQASSRSLHFVLQAKLYTQVFLSDLD